MSEQDIKNRLDLYHSVFLESRLQSEGYSKDEAKKLCNIYFRYLFLRFKYPDVDAPPSLDIDAAWKVHIIDTKNYRSFCEKFFSCRYLDRPSELDSCSEEDLNWKYNNNTQRLYSLEYDAIIPAITPTNTLSKIIRTLKRKWSKWLPITFVFAMLASGWSALAEHNLDIDQKYTSLKVAIRNNTYLQEEFYLLCQSNIKDQHPKLFVNKIYQTHVKLIEVNGNYLNILNNLINEKLITNEASGALLPFSKKMNSLFLAEFQVCDVKIPSPDEIDKIEKTLTHAIWKSRRHYLWLPFLFGIESR